MFFETGTLRLVERWKKRGYGTAWPDLGFGRVPGDFFVAISEPRSGLVSRDSAGSFGIGEREIAPPSTRSEQGIVGSCSSFYSPPVPPLSLDPQRGGTRARSNGQKA